MSAWSASTLGIVIALALLWMGIAAAIAFVAARRLALAQQVLVAARSNATLLELTPARPLAVRVDGRIDTDAQLIRELGLDSRPTRLSELAGNDSGIVADDLAALIEEV